MAWDWDYNYYPPSRPLKAKGGIKSQSKRGGFGQSWWSKRWIQVLESFNIGARLGRGRSYARSGQVLSIEIAKGKVTANVQGARSRPYKVFMKIKVLRKQEWKALAKAFSSQAAFAASLLTGRMPENIEEAFEDAGLSLFPKRRDDLQTDCSCPDWSNPCKHIAAVFYLLGEEFDRDPFLLFRLRGIERDELISLVGGATIHPSSIIPYDAPGNAKHVDGPEIREPLPDDPDAFWRASEVDERGIEVVVPPVTAALPKRLGGFPFWRGQEGFLEQLEMIYAGASQIGMGFFLGEHP